MNYRNTVSPVFNEAWLQGLLAALSTVPGAALLVTPKVHLRTDSLVPQPTDTSATYTEAAYSGYAAVALTLAGPVNAGPSYIAEVGNALFVSTTGSPFVPNNITGYYLTTGTNTLVMSENFANPIPIATAGDAIDLAVALALDLYPTPG
jgi:hypothetical protein